MTELDDNILDRAVEQASNPIIIEPTILDAEALKSAPPEPSLAERMASARPVPSIADSGPPKKRGRPPGSKNKATLLRESQDGVRQAGPMKMVAPPPKTKPDDALTASQKHELMLNRAEELSSKVAETINDNLLLVLMSMGTPVELLYKPGQEPKRVKEDSKYTEFAQSITMSPFQANIIGRFLAEMEATETGGKLGAAAADGKGPLIVYGVLSAASMIQYGKSLADAYKKIEPLLSAYRASQAVQEQQQFNQQQTTGGSQ